MIKSKFFWIGAILLAIIPFLIMDIPKHYVDWVRDVHDETIDAVQDVYHLNKKQKAETLEQIFESNKRLMAMVYIKAFLAIVLLSVCIYCFIKYRKQGRSTFWQPFVVTIILVAITISLKTYSWYSFSGNEKIRLLNLAETDTTLENIYCKYFIGKVVYVDFWGTTCGPCLNEFRSFTKPLKEKYQDRKDIAYLYICGGHKFVWKQQLTKFDIEGSHVFLDMEQYDKLYRKSIKGNKDSLILMPRYLIIDKHGKIVETNAPQPSEINSISTVLSKYLASI